MKNEFTQVMSERTDTELVKIVTIDSGKYNPMALEAAHGEIEKRRLDPVKFSAIKDKITNRANNILYVESKTAIRLLRFVNFVIDFIIWLILIAVGSYAIELFIHPKNESLITFLIFFLYFGTYLGYYAIMEIKCQKTIGKFITKTTVVKSNGDRPSAGDIITRTLCRLIPLDRLSFLLTNHGFHDRLSQTKVINDRLK